MSDIDETKRFLEDYYHRSAVPSEWLTVEQSSIDLFGQATGDMDWLHTDPERAGTEGPFDGTIAFGFWTLSMLTYLVRQSLGQNYPPGALYGLNYGFDRVRFSGIVPVGSRIRNHSKLISVELRGASQYLVKTENTIEVEHATRPALVAEWLVLIVFPS